MKLQDVLTEKTAVKGELGKWFKEKWVDISRDKKGGGHPSCGASAGSKSRKGGQRAYPKCRKASVAANMTDKEKKNAVSRKRKKYGDKGAPAKKPKMTEAEYQGRKVKLGKIMQGDAKKFKVYVKNPKGNVVKVNFGQGGGAKGGTMKIRKSNPKARKSFRARHNCDNPGPRHKARYWSCRKW